MSDDNRRPARVPRCALHPDSEVKRVRYPGVDVAICNEGGERVGTYCMSDMNGAYCQYLQHTTATHMTLAGEGWVDMKVEEDEVQVALGDEEVETEIV